MMTDRRRLGLALAGIGLVVAVGGTVALAMGNDDKAPAVVTAAESSTTTAAESSTTTAPPPSTAAPIVQVEEFVDDFVAAIENGNARFLVETLHPLVVQEFTVELCTTFIEREILALTDYSRTGEIIGPGERSVLGTLIENFYEAPVIFGFQGQTFESRATFALADGAVSWFAECR